MVNRTGRSILSGILCLALLALSALSACGQKRGNAASTETPVREKPAWEKCTVRIIEYLHGTEFYVFSSDGSYSVSYTPAICSLEAFDEGRCPVEESKTGTLPEEELEELLRIVSSVYTDGQMLPIDKREQEYRPEGMFIYVSVDGSEEAFYLICYGDNFEEYPPKEYYELLQLVYRVDPQSYVLLPNCLN